MGSAESIQDGFTSTYEVYDRMPQLAETLDYNNVESQHANCVRINNRLKLRRKRDRCRKNKNSENNQLLDNFEQQELKRSSSITDEICIHCEHNHLMSCCQYYYDTIEDALDYATWKTNLENRKCIDILNVTGIPEAISGHFSPNCFPGYSQRNPRNLITLAKPKTDCSIKFSLLWLSKLCPFPLKKNHSPLKKNRTDNKTSDNSMRTTGIFLYMI